MRGRRGGGALHWVYRVSIHASPHPSLKVGGKYLREILGPLFRGCALLCKEANKGCACGEKARGCEMRGERTWWIPCSPPRISRDPGLLVYHVLRVRSLSTRLFRGVGPPS